MTTHKQPTQHSPSRAEEALRRRVKELETEASDALRLANDLARERDQISRLAKGTVAALSRQMSGSYRNSLSIKRSVRQLLKAIADRVLPKRRARAKLVSAIRKSGYFDYRYYLATYKDVAAQGVDPIEHFVTTGWKKGRRPNQWFDTRWYVGLHPDAVAEYGNPLLHYIRRGASEGLQPSKGFDPRKYLLDRPDVALERIEPLYHQINFGQFEGRTRQIKPAPPPAVDPRFLRVTTVKQPGLLTTDFPAPKGEISVESLGPSSATLPPLNLPKVSVIVPVYADRDLTVKCLDSVVRSIPQNKSFHKLIIVDDVGPDASLRALLTRYAEQDGVELHVNSSNLGFVKSTNVGIAIAGRTDVVLLNSDTEVHADWLDRLVAHASASRVGTVTPLSNNATICSFPDIGGSSDIPPDQDLSLIDSAAATVNRGRSVPIPTGVGFCMYVKRAALDQCGALDEAAFGAGYGEETDFCQRIQSRGWQNLLATDVFVFHKGGASFGTSTNARKQKAGAIMRERFPGYEPSVAQWVGSDPAFPMRFALELALLRRRLPATVLHITHPWGGGIERHISELVGNTGMQAAHIVAMIDRLNVGIYELKLLLPDEASGWRQFEFKVRSVDAAVGLIGAISPTRIHVHHGLPDMSFVMSVLVATRVEYDLTVHDYWPICARMNLSIDGEYCGEPDEFGCMSCLAKTPSLAGNDVIAWREQSRFLLEGAARVIAPSKDVADRIARRFPTATTPVVVPHELDHYRPQSREVKVRDREGRPFRIAAVGAFNLTKGGAFLLDVVEAAQRLDLDFQWAVAGYFYPPLDKRAAGLSSVLSCSGPYENSEIDQILDELDADIVFFPQRIPETYSYTLTEVFKARLPTLTSDIGAFVERVEGTPGCWSYSVDDSPEAVALKLREIAIALSGWPVPGPGAEKASDVRYDFYQTEYVRPAAESRPSLG